MKKTLLLCVVLTLAANVFAAVDIKQNQARIEELTGLKGQFDEKEGVLKLARPRTDVKIAVNSVPLSPFNGASSWVSFMPGRTAEVMLMGDLALFQDEVNPVMSALLDNDVRVTALHNHFFYDEPRLFYMHISGEGVVEHLAAAVRKAFDTVVEVRAARSAPAAGFAGSHRWEKNAIAAAPLEQVFGMRGEAQNGMFKVVIGRQAKMACGCEIGKQMGVNTWATFAGTDENAIVDGDFAVLESELQPVLKTLRAGGINIVAIHQHMTGETPRILFLHYWGEGKAADLAHTVKNAVDKTTQLPTTAAR